jgi:hypothetical protein
LEGIGKKGQLSQTVDRRQARVERRDIAALGALDQVSHLAIGADVWHRHVEFERLSFISPATATAMARHPLLGSCDIARLVGIICEFD